MVFVCRRCRLPRNTEDYYDSQPHVCKACIKKRVRLWYRKTRRARAQYERERQHRPERKTKALEYQRRRRRKYPQKEKARRAVAYALSVGKLVRRPCVVCRSRRRVQAHHYDYNKPLDVTWLCFKHHRENAHGQKTA